MVSGPRPAWLKWTAVDAPWLVRPSERLTIRYLDPDTYIQGVKWKYTKGRVFCINTATITVVSGN